MKENKGITLIALIITIIILLILAGITINMVIGENGLFNKAKSTTETYKKQVATEKIELKIAAINLQSYETNREKATLQYLADNLCEDDEIEYVLKQSKATASIPKINLDGVNSIFTKLKSDPYEFEINSSLKIEKIDGSIVLNNNDDNNNVVSNSDLKPKIGDYVSYSQKLIGKDSITTSIETDLSKTGASSKQLFKTDTSKQWRVIDVDEENDIVKIVATSNVYDINGSGLILTGENGFLKGKDELNELCNNLYSTSFGTARSISVEDINKLSNFTDPSLGSGLESSRYGSKCKQYSR